MDRRKELEFYEKIEKMSLDELKTVLCRIDKVFDIIGLISIVVLSVLLAISAILEIFEIFFIGMCISMYISLRIISMVGKNRSIVARAIKKQTIRKATKKTN